MAPDERFAQPSYVFLASSTSATTANDYPLLARTGTDVRRFAEHREDVLLNATNEVEPEMRTLKGIGTVAYMNSIGVSALTAGTDAWIVDRRGLADPIGSRIESTSFIPGHQKDLPLAVAQARFGDRSEPVPPDAERFRNALRCGELRDLIEAVNTDLTAGRFLSNLYRSQSFAIVRNRSQSFAMLQIPRSGLDAERTFCGDE